MIDYDYNNYQPEPRKPEQPKPQTGDETVKWLENHCGFRPIGLEW